MKKIYAIKWTRQDPDSGYYLATTEGHGTLDYETTLCGRPIPSEDEAMVSDCGYISCRKCAGTERLLQAEERREWVDDKMTTALTSKENVLRHGLFTVAEVRSVVKGVSSHEVASALKRLGYYRSKSGYWRLRPI